ncbi:UPF0764 protein C16orf89 homolog isoform X2 [Marmota monax]|uniref:UPF0764 protein C16orf89 homolog isoform X2 n=1 Tax=Marmota monax TaxID=9995 RepID=UPI001EB0853E|nr:UPF0764 protein C16orf89 homolog isoform X2 [Marmota monax]
MARPGLLLLLLALRPLQPSPLPRPDTTEGKVTIVGLILSALERATLFLEERLPGVNLDGVVGFRVLEAQLRGVQEEWAADPRLRPLSLRTRRLADKLAALLRRSVFYLELSDPRYLREFLPSLQPGFWKLPCTWTHTNTSLVYPVLEPEDSFSEESSDACLVQLLGTGNSSQPCRIPDFCRTLMTQPNCSGYRLSHQLLFFLWARMQGCTEGLFHQSQHYISVFCANMMELTRRAEAIGYAYPTRDLFMENIMLCGISGFSDFYKLRWLEAILSWQRPWEGCFGKPGELRLSCQGGGPPHGPSTPPACSKSEEEREAIHRWLLLPQHSRGGRSPGGLPVCPGGIPTRKGRAASVHKTPAERLLGWTLPPLLPAG